MIWVPVVQLNMKEYEQGMVHVFHCGLVDIWLCPNLCSSTSTVAAAML